jgi:putative ABC transport system permease protein
MLLAVAIGVFAVILLSGLGEGARAFALNEFSSLVHNTLIILPGRNETTGGMPPITGLSPRQLTAQDAQSIARLPHVLRVAPQQAGQLQVSAGNRSREALALGTRREFFAIRQLRVAQGSPCRNWVTTRPKRSA